MNKDILIIGSTGMLGSKLLNYMYKEKIPANTITCFSNKKKLLSQKKRFNINNFFILSLSSDKKKFLKLISKKKIFDYLFFRLWLFFIAIFRYYFKK